MSNVLVLPPRHRWIDRATFRVSLFLAIVGVLAASTAQAAGVVPAAKPTVSAGFTITKVADPPKDVANCDDLGYLDGNLYLGCKNRTTSNGEGGNSTLVAFTPAGAVVQTWSVKHQIDGLAGDPLTHQVIISLDENENALLATVTPSAPAGRQVIYYNLSPDPRGATTPIALRTGGGTNHVAVDAAGHVLVSASNGQTIGATAVFKVALTPPSSPSGIGTATLRPTFLNNAIATKGNDGTGTTRLELIDIDSAAIVPTSSPRFGGSYVVSDQTALELVFANNIFKGTGLTVLKLQSGVDDLVWPTTPAGTLYVVDFGVSAELPKTASSALWKVTGPFTTNMVLASNDADADQVVEVNLTTGALTPFIRHLNTAKGLVYLNPDGSHTELPLNGANAVPVSSKTTTATTKANSSGSTGSALIAALVLVVLLVAVGGFAMMRRRTASPAVTPKEAVNG